MRGTWLYRLLRGVWLLRHPELAQALGDLRTTYKDWAEVSRHFPQSVIHPSVLVQGWLRDNLSLGGRVRIEQGCVLALGDDFNGYGVLEIGARTWVGQYNNFRLAGNTHITIGSNCLISQFCTFAASNHYTGRDSLINQRPCVADRANITVGEDVWVGAGAAIMPGVNVGPGAVIGANSVVTDSVPGYEIWAGSPARKIGERQ